MNGVQLRTFISRAVALAFHKGCVKTVGALLDDTTAYFHLSVSMVGWSFTILGGIGLVVAPAVGGLMDVASSRVLAVIGGFLSGVGFLCVAASSSHVWLLFAGNILTGCGFGLLLLPTNVALAETFGEDYGVANSICIILSTIGVVVLPLLTEYWRGRYGLIGAVTLLGALMWNQIICGLLLPAARGAVQRGSVHIADNENQPSSSSNVEREYERENSGSVEAIGGEEVDEYPSASTGLPERRNFLVSHPLLLFFFVSMFIASASIVGWATFLISLGTAKGFAPSDAVFFMTVGGVGLAIGHVLVMIIFRYQLMNSLAIWTITTAILPCAFALCAMAKAYFPIALLSLTHGVCLGLLKPWIVTYVKYMVCPQHFKAAIAWGSVCSGVGIVISGPVSGLVQEIRGSYDDVFLFLAVLAIGQGVPMIPAIYFNRQSTTTCNEEP